MGMETELCPFPSHVLCVISKLQSRTSNQDHLSLKAGPFLSHMASLRSVTIHTGCTAGVLSALLC